MRLLAAFARGLNAGAAGFNWTAFAIWGNWWNLAAGAFSTAVVLFLLGSSVPRWWHSLFHMAEPCGLCGHTRKHNQFEAGWCNERTTEGLPDPVFSSVVSTGKRCLCDRRKMNEHRKSQARGQGSAGAAAFLAGGPINPYGNPAAGANQGLNPQQYQQYQQQIQKLMQSMPRSLGQLPSPTPPALPEADWTDETYTGYRAFVLYADAERGVFRLKSVTNGTVWESDTLHAQCKSAGYDLVLMRDLPSKPVEDMARHIQTCGCGIYLCADKQMVVRQVFAETLDQQGNQLVMGECSGWGTVIEHTDGMRVEYARIERLWTLSGKPELCDRLAGIYGVPCTNLWANI